MQSQHHCPSQFSGGEQQRLFIVRALINDPDILIADEPTGNLDEANERVVLELFQKLRSEGKTILLITHNPDLGQFDDNKLIDRGTRMLMSEFDLSYEDARTLLLRHGSVRIASESMKQKSPKK